MLIRSLIAFFLLCSVAQGTEAQKSKGNIIDSKFEFQDGFYRSVTELQNNKPSEDLLAVGDFQYEFDSEENVIFPTDATIQNIGKTKLGSFENIWGLSMYGDPYIKIQPDKTQSDVFFVRLHVVGEISYFYYKSFENRTVMMNIYNPITGIKIAEKEVVNREQSVVKKLMRFADGELIDYNLENFKNLIKEDKRLANSYNSLEDWEAKEKLFKTLLIYNDRHPIKPTQ